MAKTKIAGRPPRPDTDAAPPPPAAAPEFPGCRPVHLPRSGLEGSDQRLEYWDGATETAWICDPVSPYHERPSRRLTALVGRIAQVRGAHVESYGSMDLRQQGWPQSIMQADESVYLRPARTTAVLERVGTVLGEREGTGPDHDPLLRSQRRRGFERGVEHGIERGRAEGERTLLCRQAAQKFDEDTARQLAELLEHAAGPDRLSQAGIGIIESKTSAEFLARVAGRDARDVNPL